MLHDQEMIFLDTETTGSNPLRDRIIEVGLYRVADNEKKQVWNHLINPQTFIPYYIEKLTSINAAMLENAPLFSEIADELHALLKGKIIIAHNARFDYAFLKNEFKRCGIYFKEKTLCTVKLSRQLFPEQKSHSLDAITHRFGLIAEGRHRALADVELMYQFFQLAQSRFTVEDFQKTIKILIKNPSLPAHIHIDDIQHIPKTAGIYKFYDEQDCLIYIGKSVCLQERVLSHFSADHRCYKEMRLAQRVKKIDWIETVGEFGALLMEAQLVKQEMPVQNRRLRKHRNLFTIRLDQNEQGYQKFQVVDFNHTEQSPHLYGVFRNKTEAHNKINELAKTHLLCHKLAGLEKTRGSCFNYQLKKCKGACVGLEPVALYNLRVTNAVFQLEHKPWPFTGKIALVEHCPLTERTVYHLFDTWCYLGTAQSELDLADDTNDESVCFDIDIYRLLKKYIPLFAKHGRILKLN